MSKSLQEDYYHIYNELKFWLDLIYVPSEAYGRFAQGSVD